MQSKGSNSKRVASAYLEPDACRAVHMPLHCRKQAGQLEHQHLHHTHTQTLSTQMLALNMCSRAQKKLYDAEHANKCKFTYVRPIG